MARPRKTNVRRSASGKSLGEPHVIAQEVLAVRKRENARMGLYLDEPSDALAGFTLGVLLLRSRQDRGNPGGITQTQYDAGDRWSAIVRRHANIMGYELKRGAGQIKSPSFSMIGSGKGCGPDADDQQIAEVRDQFRSTYDAVMEVSRAHRLGVSVRDILYAVCVDNRPVLDLSEVDYGNLRLGLNALARVLRV